MEKQWKSEETRSDSVDAAGSDTAGSGSGSSWLDQLTPRPESEPEGGFDVTPAVSHVSSPAEANPPSVASVAGGSADPKPLGTQLPRELPEEVRDMGEDVGLSVRRLRESAIDTARRDAGAGLPDLESSGRTESEEELTNRCSALFQNWQSRERDRLNSVGASTEEAITEALGRTGLELDRFERTTSELFRLKKRWEARRDMVSASLEDPSEDLKGERGLKTRWYLLSIAFLWFVELLANSPVFGALLPRDPLTEQQLRVVAETSEGWFAGATRVVSHFILRPDAFFLAAGVVTFLLLLAHFFGRSLRGLLVQKSAETGGETVSHQAPLEFIIPMVLSGVGLVLVLGVLFEARVTLGEVAIDRFAHDSSAVEELRRTASWLRVDGNLVAANQQANRADDLEALAKEQREYAASMSSLSLPILLLNSTLVLVAITSGYFHMRDRRRERFNELPFERDRHELISTGELAAHKASGTLSQLVRHIRSLQSLLEERPLKQWQGLVHQLEGTIMAYRAENGRVRGLDSRAIPAFAAPVELDLTLDETEARALVMRSPQEYESERQLLAERFDSIRARFTEEATAW